MRRKSRATDLMLRRVVLLAIATVLACASAFVFTARPPVNAVQQCAAPIAQPPALLFMKTVDLDDELDNSEIAEDENILPARKCGFCMG